MITLNELGSTLGRAYEFILYQTFFTLFFGSSVFEAALHLRALIFPPPFCSKDC